MPNLTGLHAIGDKIWQFSCIHKFFEVSVDHSRTTVMIGLMKFVSLIRHCFNSQDHC